MPPPIPSHAPIQTSAFWLFGGRDGLSGPIASLRLTKARDRRQAARDSPDTGEVDVAQISTARLWPARSAEAGRRQASAGDRMSRTRRFYLTVSFAFAVVTYLAVQLIRAGGELLTATNTAQDPLTGNILVHAPSLVAWVSACMLAGLAAPHYLSRLGTSLNAEPRRGEKL